MKHGGSLAAPAVGLGLLISACFSCRAATPLHSTPQKDDGAVERLLRAPDAKPVVPPLVRELLTLVDQVKLHRANHGFEQNEKGLTLHYHVRQRGSEQEISALFDRLRRWGRSSGFKTIRNKNEWQLTRDRGSLRHRLQAKQQSLMGSPENTLDIDVAVTLTKLRTTRLANLEQWPALSGGARLPAYLRAALDGYPLRSFGCTGYPGPCNYWSFELSDEVDPRRAMTELVARGREHGFSFEHSSADPTASWLGSFQECAHAHLSYKIVDGRLRVTLQASSLDFRDITSVVRCSAQKTTQVPEEDPAGSTRIRDILVLDWHRAHIDKVARCYREHRRSQQIETTVRPWDKLGNTLRLSLIDTGRQYRQTTDRLAPNSSQASIDIFHYPHTGKPASRFGVRFWTKSSDGAVVIATFGQRTRNESPVEIGVQFHLEDQWIGLSLPGVDSPKALEEEGAFNAAVRRMMQLTHERELRDVDELTDCDPAQIPACARIPASEQAKERARRRAILVDAQRKKLLTENGHRFRSLTKTLYPFGKAACSLGMRDSGS
ncbi:MAG: hypothetical protein VB934_21790 [Polyangiaceae bacterium]